MPPEVPTDEASFQAVTGCTDVQLEKLVLYRELLGEWSTRFNLIGPSALESFWNRHAYDSWQLVGLEPQARIWADLGSGAGLPGIVIAVALAGQPGVEAHLIESQAKRCTFLSHVTKTLNLPATIHNARAESFSIPVEVVTARACAPLDRLLSFAQPWMTKGAVGLFLKGEAVEAEVVEARRHWTFDVSLTPSASDPGGRVVRIERLLSRGR